nr:uncharacterized protein LOC114088904 isoform X2 [Marmota flaviventris]
MRTWTDITTLLICLILCVVLTTLKLYSSLLTLVGKVLMTVSSASHQLHLRRSLYRFLAWPLRSEKMKSRKGEGRRKEEKRTEEGAWIPCYTLQTGLPFILTMNLGSGYSMPIFQTLVCMELGVLQSGLRTGRLLAQNTSLPDAWRRWACGFPSSYQSAQDR